MTINLNVIAILTCILLIAMKIDHRIDISWLLCVSPIIIVYLAPLAMVFIIMSIIFIYELFKAK